jgi:hypothetical protein
MALSPARQIHRPVFHFPATAAEFDHDSAPVVADIYSFDFPLTQMPCEDSQNFDSQVVYSQQLASPLRSQRSQRPFDSEFRDTSEIPLTLSAPKTPPEYFDSVLAQLRLDDDLLNPRTDLFAIQKEVDKSDRTQLTCSIIELAPQLELESKTVFLALKTFDRLLLKKSIPKSDILLYGICCLDLAAKFETQDHSPIQAILSAVGADFTEDTVIGTEIDIFADLEFKLNTSTIVLFLRVLLNQIQCPPEVPTMVLFIALCSLTSPELAILKSQTVAVASLIVALDALGLNPKPPQIDSLVQKLGLDRVRQAGTVLVTAVNDVVSDDLSIITILFSSEERGAPALRGPFEFPDL